MYLSLLQYMNFTKQLIIDLIDGSEDIMKDIKLALNQINNVTDEISSDQKYYLELEKKKNLDSKDYVNNVYSGVNNHLRKEYKSILERKKNLCNFNLWFNKSFIFFNYHF